MICVGTSVLMVTDELANGVRLESLAVYSRGLWLDEVPLESAVTV